MPKRKNSQCIPHSSNCEVPSVAVHLISAHMHTISQTEYSENMQMKLFRIGFGLDNDTHRNSPPMQDLSNCKQRKHTCIPNHHDMPVQQYISQKVMLPQLILTRAACPGCILIYGWQHSYSAVAKQTHARIRSPHTLSKPWKAQTTAQCNPCMTDAAGTSKNCLQGFKALQLHIEDRRHPCRHPDRPSVQSQSIAGRKLVVLMSLRASPNNACNAVFQQCNLINRSN